MGKQHKHLKQLKSEKSKVKLKVRHEKTKFLPKGGNVTDTTFKIKPIVVSEQFKTNSDGQIVNQKNQSIKDLTKKLTHYNTNVRTDTCHEIQQLITANKEELISRELNHLIHNVSPLLIDSKKSVRKSAIKLMGYIMKEAGETRLQPFFSIISGYARSAMTHIDRPIQEDSLSMLHVLLNYAPQLVAGDADKFLTNFLALISRLKREKFGQRTVSVELRSEMTSVLWRIKVLSLLWMMLERVVKERIEERSEDGNEEIVIVTDNTRFVPIYSALNMKTKCPIDFYNEIEAKVADENDFTKNVKALIPLLHEIWLEVAPEDRNELHSSTIIKAESAIVLNYVLKISSCLLQLPLNVNDTKNNEMLRTFSSSDLLQSVLKKFPYTQSETESHNFGEDVQKLQKQINSDTKCTPENLLVCQLFCQVFKEIETKFETLTARKIVHYIEKCLGSFNFSQIHLNLLVNVVKQLLLHNSESWFKKHVSTTKVFENLVSYNKNTKMSEIYRIEVFDVLSKILDKPYLRRQPLFEVWLSSLPSLLCEKSIPEKILDTLLLIAKQNNEQFFISFMKKLIDILDNLPKIRVTESKLEMLSNLKIIWLFYYLPPFNREAVEAVLQFLKNYPEFVNRKNFIDVLKLRAQNKESVQISKLILQYC